MTKPRDFTHDKSTLSDDALASLHGGAGDAMLSALAGLFGGQGAAPPTTAGDMLTASSGQNALAAGAVSTVLRGIGDSYASQARR
jgi:hypothetical protein